MPQKQAIAVAIKVCAPEKAIAGRRPKKKRSTQEQDVCMLADDVSTIPGGGYSWSENEDGSFNIHDVPIMGELPRGARENRHPLGRSWHLAVIERARRRLDEDQYLAPLHIRHHSEHDKNATTRAGFVLPKATRRMYLDGRKQWVLFADLLRIPKALFEKIKNGELPYRSVEIPDPDRSEPEVLSLALLPDEAPFFKLPLLTLAKESSAEPRAHVGTITTEDHVGIVFRFAGGTTMKKQRKTVIVQEPPTKELEEKEPKEEKEKETPALEEIMSALGNLADRLGKRKLEENDLSDIADELRRCIERLQRVVDWWREVEDEFTPEGEEEEEEEEEGEAAAAEPPVEEEEDKEKMATVKARCKPRFVENVTALQAKVAALEARERARARLDLVDQEIAKLRNDGWHVDAATRRSFVQLAKAGGEKALAEALRMFRATVPQDTDDDEAEVEMKGPVNVPGEVLRYAAISPEAEEVARQAWSDWRSLRDLGKTTMPLDRFVRAQLTARGIKV